MEETFQEPTQLSKGIDLKDLLSSQSEFQIDLNFKQKMKVQAILNGDHDSDDDNDEEDTFDFLKDIERNTEKLLLSSPEYYSFDELGSKMVDCLASGDVKMLVLEEGNGPLVPIDAEVKIHYAAYWEKGTIPFDSTLTMNMGMPLSVRLGVGRVLPGLEIGLTMVKGPSAKLMLLLKPKMSWGELGALPRIKPETALFVVSLYEVTDVNAQHRFNELPTTEQSKFQVTQTTLGSLHANAKDLFSKKKYFKAMKNYQQCIHVINLSRPETSEQEDTIKQLKIKTCVNLMMCYYKLKKPLHVIKLCENFDHFTDIDKHCKALFYYGRANEMLGKGEEALKYYKRALKLEPKNKEIGKTLADLDMLMKKSLKNEKQMWQNVFESSKKDEKEKNAMDFDVDEDFRNLVKDTCTALESREDYAKFDLPTGLNRNEVNCIKSLTNQFKSLVLMEEGFGSKKTISIVKKV